MRCCSSAERTWSCKITLCYKSEAVPCATQMMTPSSKLSPSWPKYAGCHHCHSVSQTYAFIATRHAPPWDPPPNWPYIFDFTNEQLSSSSITPTTHIDSRKDMVKKGKALFPKGLLLNIYFWVWLQFNSQISCRSSQVCSLLVKQK